MIRIVCFVISWLIICSIHGQTHFLGISKNEISARNYIEKQITNYSQSNIRLLDTTYQSLELKIADLINLDYQSIVEDLNACPNITHLKINYFGGFKRVDYSKVSPFPFDSLKHIEYLQLYAWNSRIQDSTLIERLTDMPSLDYLHMHRGNGFDFQVPDAKRLWNKLKGLALIGLYDPVNLTGANLKELNVSGKDSLMHLIVSDLNSCKELQTLSIGFDSLTYLSAQAISKVTNLKHLLLSNKKNAGHVNQILSRLQKLEFLSLTGAKGDEFEGGNSDLKSVKLTTSSGKHDDAINALGKYRNLKKLDIRIGKEDSIIAADFSPFANLQELTISGGELTEIDKSIGSVASLKKLIVKYQKLTSLPPTFSNLTQLEELDLNGNNLTSIPDLGKMHNLKKLVVWNNKLKKLPKGIGNLKSLVELNVRGNYIQSLPDDIGRLTALQNLFLYDNYIEELPRTICNLSNLKVLDLSTNCLQRLPQCIGELNNLTELRLFNNKPSYIDKSRKRLKECENEIQSIPKSIEKCNNLSVLSISSAGVLDSQDIKTILSIPNNELKVNLRECNISSLPKRGWNGAKISSIDLSRNKINELPIELLYCEIPEINLKKNDIGIYSQNYDNKNLKTLALYGKGLVDKETILRRDGMKETIVKVCSRFYYIKEHNPILTYLPLAIEIDPVYVEQNIDTENYAEALLKVERFEDAIDYYTQTIDRQMNSGIRLANSIAINLQNRHKAFLAIGDTLSAIDDLKLIQSEFNYNMSPQIFSLLVESEQYEKSKTFADSTILLYEKLLEKEDTIDQGIALSIMEVFLVTDDTISFDKAKRKYYNLSWNATNSKIYEYLILIRNISRNTSSRSDVDHFINELNKSKFTNTSWGCSLVAAWSKQFDYSKRNAMEKLNAVICRN